MYMYDSFSDLNVNEQDVLQSVDSSSNISSDKATFHKDDTESTSDKEQNKIKVLLESLQLNGNENVFLMDVIDTLCTCS